jgi:hypothetical protein
MGSCGEREMLVSNSAWIGSLLLSFLSLLNRPLVTWGVLGICMRKFVLFEVRRLVVLLVPRGREREREVPSCKSGVSAEGQLRALVSQGRWGSRRSRALP